MTELYTAWALRYVPNVVRGEFINFAILAGRDGGDWALRHTADLSRATCLGAEQPRPTSLLSRFLTQVDYLNGEPAGQDERRLWNPLSEPLTVGAVRQVSLLSHNAMQFSDAMPSVGSSADDVAARLYEHLVVDPVHRARAQPRTALRRRIRELIEQVEIPEAQTLQRPRLHSREATARVDFLFGASGPVKLTHCLTFARQDAELSLKESDHWTLFVDGIRRRGATSQIGAGRHARTVTIPRDIEVSVVHDTPSNPGQVDALAAAMDGWNRFEIQPVPASHAADDVARTAELLPA